MRPAIEQAGSLKARVLEAARRDMERRQWEAANPEVACAWNEANEVQRGRQQDQARAEHERAEMARVGDFLATCGVFPREAAVLAAGLEERETVRAAREFWASDEAFLLYCDSTGEGKTIAAVSLMAECRFPCHLPGLGATWCWPTVLSHRPRYELAGTLAQASHYGSEADDSRRRAITCRLLVLDELGAEVMTEPWLSRLEHIIDQRYRAKRRTVLVSNLNKREFKKRYGDRIARRIRDDGQVWPPSADLRAVPP